MEVGMRPLDIKYLCKMVTEQSHAQNFLAGNILVTQIVDRRLVEYYDHDKTQTFAAPDVAFRKHRSFSWQSEYRIVFTSEIAREPKSFIGIGDISDIALVCSLEQFNSGLRMSTSPS